MISQIVRGAAARRAGLLVACLAVVCGTQLVGAGKSPMRILKYDPAAEKMDLFAALDAGAVTLRVVAHDSEGGNVYIENLSGKPLTVNLPEAVAMVQVLKQGFFGNNQPGGANGNANGLSSAGGGSGQSGGAQSLGSGFGQQNNNNGAVGSNNGNAVPNGIPGVGIFSIPAERVAQVPFRSVCLNYGKPDPSPRMTYKVVPLENYSSNAVLQETVRIFGRGGLDRTVAQAATWHLTDKLSWNDLANIKKYTLPGVYTSQVPIFSTSELETAQKLVEQATKQSQERPAAAPKSNSTPGAVTPSVRTASARNTK
ncbi:MAG: hypothetical protein JWN70_2774 [Planctomycetaceae bacterium]|nr:hypothetical protein [Planctomycetaceae bacterium]